MTDRLKALKDTNVAAVLVSQQDAQALETARQRAFMAGYEAGFTHGAFPLDKHDPYRDSYRGDAAYADWLAHQTPETPER